MSWSHSNDLGTRVPREPKRRYAPTPAVPYAVLQANSVTRFALDYVVKPLYVTFTGLDDATKHQDLVMLSTEFPIEWSILFHPAREGTGRYPTLNRIRSFLELDLKFCAHLCGPFARSVVDGQSLPKTIVSLLGRVSRIQINTAQRDVDPARIAAFAKRFGARAILQCRDLGRFPDNRDVDWLFDRSGGKGQLPEQWPVPDPSAKLVGYSGGLGPETIEDALVAISSKHPEAVPFWIDMENAVRTGDLLDVTKCRRVCEVIFGAGRTIGL